MVYLLKVMLNLECSVDSLVPFLLRLWVRIPMTPITLFHDIFNCLKIVIVTKVDKVGPNKFKNVEPILFE